MIKLIIPGRLSNLNDYTLECRRNKFCGSKLKRDNENKVKRCIKEQNIEPFKDEDYPLFFKYKWIEPNKKRDLDNIAFAKKFIQDALAGELKIIKNDGWQQIAGFSDFFNVDKDNPRVEVEIYKKGEY